MINTQVERRIKPVTHDIVSASNVFGRFKREGRHEVRQPDITGQTYIEQVKRTREMLRSMKSDAVSQIIEFRRDLNFFEALALAKEEGKLIVPNDVHDRILTETKDKEFLLQNYPVRTGTLIIYEAPDKPFGEQVVFSWKDDSDEKYSVSFTIPEQFRGRANCALVIEHPDFEVLNLGDNRYALKVTDEKIHQIEQFPKQDCWYIPHTETGIPQGTIVKKSSDSRRIWRFNDSAYLGPVVRDVDDIDGSLKQVVNAFCRSTVWFGVAFIGLGEATPKEGYTKPNK